jgi:hypothetical protein
MDLRIAFAWRDTREQTPFQEEKKSLVNLYKPSVKSVTPGEDLPLFLACEILMKQCPVYR